QLPDANTDLHHAFLRAWLRPFWPGRARWTDRHRVRGLGVSDPRELPLASLLPLRTGGMAVALPDLLQAAADVAWQAAGHGARAGLMIRCHRMALWGGARSRVRTGLALRARIELTRVPARGGSEGWVQTCQRGRNSVTPQQSVC